MIFKDILEFGESLLTRIEDQMRHTSRLPCDHPKELDRLRTEL